jgi:hypothetical protein
VGTVSCRDLPDCTWWPVCRCCRRKAIVEPVFGQIMTCQDGRQLLLRGEDGARGEWRLLAACHNLRKIFRHAGTAGLPTATG